MKVLVCGGRNYEDQKRLFEVLDDIHEAAEISLLIEGGAEGADKRAGRWAMDRGVDRVTVWANWERDGRRAGPIRNRRMLDFKPDVLIAFPGGKGTRNMVTLAKAAGVQVVRVDGESED